MSFRLTNFLCKEGITKYSKTHEWVRQISDQRFRVGISTHAQEQLGEVVFVDLPKLNAKFSRNAVVATLESVKAVGEVFCPLADATVVAVNESLKDRPGLINADAEGEGWIAEFESKEMPSELVGEEEYKH
jgi:glycine cleavage system H protein